jgi:hypothetical protein
METRDLKKAFRYSFATHNYVHFASSIYFIPSFMHLKVGARVYNLKHGRNDPAEVVEIGSGKYGLRFLDDITLHNTASEEVMGMEGEEKTALFMVADSVSSEVIERNVTNVLCMNTVLHTFTYSTFWMKNDV